MTLFKACKKCGGDVIYDPIDGLKCLQCGEEFIKEKEMNDRMTRILERKKYYDKNREEICRDYEGMPIKDFRVKWGMPPSTWNGLHRRWKRDGYNVPDLKGGRQKREAPDDLIRLKAYHEGYRQAVLDMSLPLGKGRGK